MTEKKRHGYVSQLSRQEQKDVSIFEGECQDKASMNQRNLDEGPVDHLTDHSPVGPPFPSRRHGGGRQWELPSLCFAFEMLFSLTHHCPVPREIQSRF